MTLFSGKTLAEDWPDVDAPDFLEAGEILSVDGEPLGARHRVGRGRLVQGDISFEADKTTVQTKEEFTLSACVPGADGLRFVRLDEPDEPRENGGGDHLSEHYDTDRSGTYSFLLEERFGDGWEKVGDVENPIAIEVGSNGLEIARPVIGMPATIAKDAFAGCDSLVAIVRE